MVASVVIAAIGSAAAAGVAGLSAQAVIGYAIISGTAAAVKSAIDLWNREDPSSPSGHGPPRLESSLKDGIRIARYALGTVRVRQEDSQTVFAAVDVAADGNRYLHLVQVLSEGPCHGVKSVWLDGREAMTGTPDGGFQSLEPVNTIADDVAGGMTLQQARDSNQNRFRAIDAANVDYGAWCWAKVYPSGGQIDETDVFGARLSALPEWRQDAYRFSGKCYVHLILSRSNLISPFASVPRIEYVLEGLMFAYPGQAVAEFTDNAAAVRWWFHRHRLDLPESGFDASSVAAAIALCGQEVSVSGVPEGYTAATKRYSVNGWVLADPALNEQYLAEMDFAWAGFAVESGGKLHFRPGSERAPFANLTADNIVSTGEYRPQVAIQERINSVSMVLGQSADNDYQTYDLPAIEDSAAVADDGRLWHRSLGTRSFVAYPVAAMRLLRIQLRRARHEASLSLVVKTDPENFAGRAGTPILPSDRVTVTHPVLGFNRSRWMVVSVQRRADWTLALELQEAPDGIYADSTDLPELSDRALAPVREPEPPIPENVLPVSEVSLAADGSVVSGLTVTWSVRYQLHTEVTVTGAGGFERHLSALPGTGRVEVESVPAGAYSVSVHHVNRDGRSGAARAANVNVSWSSLVPAAPMVHSVDLRNNQVWFEFSPAAVDVSGVEFRYRSKEIDDVTAFAGLPSNAQWASLSRFSAGPLVPVAAGRRITSFISVPATARYQVFARFLTRSGLESAIVNVGEYLVSAGVSSAGTVHFHPGWSGTRTLLGSLWADGVTDNLDEMLVPDPANANSLSYADFNGENGWPFGAVASVFEGLVAYDSIGNYDVRYELDTFVPAGGVAAGAAAVDFRGSLSSGAGAPSWVSAGDGSAFTRLNAIDRLGVRLSRSTLTNSAFRGLSVHWRHLL